MSLADLPNNHTATLAIDYAVPKLYPSAMQNVRMGISVMGYVFVFSFLSPLGFNTFIAQPEFSVNIFENA